MILIGIVLISSCAEWCPFSRQRCVVCPDIPESARRKRCSRCASMYCNGCFAFTSAISSIGFQSTAGTAIVLIVGTIATVSTWLPCCSNDLYCAWCPCRACRGSEEISNTGPFWSVDRALQWLGLFADIAIMLTTLLLALAQSGLISMTDTRSTALGVLLLSVYMLYTILSVLSLRKAEFFHRGLAIATAAIIVISAIVAAAAQ